MSQFSHSKIVTIAGSNGKGQTSRILEKMLLMSKKSVALWTSPHLISVTERFSFEGRSVLDEELISTFEEVKGKLEGKNSKLSYYEFLFVCFLYRVKNSKTFYEFLILEVGLGGRLDATNAIDCDIAVLTSISRDHQEILGSRYSDILKEKLGVTRKGKPLFSALELEFLQDKVEKAQKEDQFIWKDLFREAVLRPQDHFSTRNEYLAKSVFNSLVGEQFCGEFDYSKLGCRIYKLCGDASFYFYPSHNPDGARKLVQFLAHAQYNYSKCLVSFSQRDKNDLQSMMKTFLDFFGKEKLKLCYFEHGKALGHLGIQRIGIEADVDVIKDKESFFESAFKSGGEFLVTGSNYFIAELSRELNEFISRK